MKEICVTAMNSDSKEVHTGMLESRCMCCNSPKIENLNHLMINGDLASFLWDFFGRLTRIVKRFDNFNHFLEY